MDIYQLAAQVGQPSLHRIVLKGFNGPYSLGVGKAQNSDEAVLVLMVPPSARETFPSAVKIGNDSVSVVVKRDFQQPVPLGSRGGNLVSI
ncbi:hypothetical protein [Duganella sp. Root1480D1]|uniref:hypothetical protein n=1 Tax=Duganella sp. Root1480D1 TaxID=1736471 RepID=UPI000A7DA2C3|nr:hypothetical protein [Duganella sp. Root1480D1]